MKKIAILGTGPAGLLAGFAAARGGHFVSFFGSGSPGSPTKSEIGGAQFLHRPIPGIHSPDDPDFAITYKVAGSPRHYQAKVYGESEVPFVSMSNVRDGEVVPAWSLRLTYDYLWDYLIGDGSRVNIVKIDPSWLITLIEDGPYDLIVSTIPRPAICLAHAGMIDGRPHGFSSQAVRIMNSPALPLSDNTVWYDGTRNVSWYRTSLIDGSGSTEWGDGAPPNLFREEEIITIKKPISHDCSCFHDQVMFAGRFGEWTKGVLSHSAFEKVCDALH